MYFDSDFASVEWNDDVKVAVLTWKKFASGENFRNPSQKALDLAISKKASKWYSNTLNAGVFSEEDRDWFNTKIVPTMLENGINRSALIVPKSVISNISLKHAADAASKVGLAIKYFPNEDEALEWLKH